jgi:hypothetical protein
MNLDLAEARHLIEEEPGFWVGPAPTQLHYDSARSMHWREAEDSSGWHRHRAQIVVGAVTRFPPPGMLMDLGGGNGYVSRALVQAGIPSLLVEPVHEATRTAYQRGLRPVVCSTIEGAGFAPGSLPAIGMFDVLEHIESDHDQLVTIHDLLAPEGRLYLTVPKHPWLWSGHDVEAGHQRRYTTRALLATVRAAGFVEEYHTSFFSVLLAPMAVRRIVHPRRRSTAGKVNDPTGGEGGAARILERALQREALGLRKRPRRLGTSILLIAKK